MVAAEKPGCDRGTPCGLREEQSSRVRESQSLPSRYKPTGESFLLLKEG